VKEKLKPVLKLLIKTVVIIAVIWAMLTFVFGIYHFKGNNMYPAIKDGDLILTFRLEDYKLNEVVAYSEDGKVKIARIVGLPGSEINYDDEGFTIDGAHPFEQVFYPTEFPEEGIKLPYKLGDNEYFLLNDFRTENTDSRTSGAISKDSLEGKVIYLFRRRGF
jgi:signal peptidase I